MGDPDPGQGPVQTRREVVPFIAPEDMKTSERLPGWQGRYWRSESMSFAHYAIAAGASIHEHQHPHEEVWTVIEGQLEVTIEGQTQVAGPGTVATAVIANHPVRHDFL